MDLVLRINDTATGKVLAEHNIRPSDVKIESGPDGRPLPDLSDPFAEGRGGFQFDHALLTAGGTHLLIGGRTTSKIYLFDGGTGRETAVFKTEKPLQGLAVSPDGRLIATFEEDISPQQGQPGPRRHSPTLRLRDHASQKIVREVTLPGRYAYRAAFSADGELISFTTSQVDAKTRSRRTRLSVFDVETLKEVAGMDVEPNSIRTMAFAHGGGVLGTGYADSSVLLWDLEKLRETGGLPR
jgi:WD40 repeat protein